MPYCSECGTEISGEEKYCPNCGANRTQEHQTETTTSATSDTLNLDDTSLLFDAELEKKMAYGGVAVASIGSFLPWASVFGTTLLGIDGDGIITLILSIILAVGIYAIGWERRTILGTIAVGALVTLIPLISLSGISSFGVYVTLIGGVAMVVAGQSGYRRQS